MKSGIRVSVIAGLAYAGIGLLAACSDTGSSLVGVDPTDESSAVTTSATVPSVEAAVAAEPDGSGRTIETVLRPGSAPNSRGEARHEENPGTANDSFRSEATIAKSDFDVLGITPANGFNDENVRLVVLRNGAQVFATRMNFADNNPNSIDFKVNITGAATPELQAGDVVRVFVNGHLALRGTLRN